MITVDAEAAEIYLILKEISSQGINTRGLFFHGYANGSEKFQDMLKGFLDRVPYLLITHITIIQLRSPSIFPTRINSKCLRATSMVNVLRGRRGCAIRRFAANLRPGEAGFSA